MSSTRRKILTRKEYPSHIEGADRTRDSSQYVKRQHQSNLARFPDFASGSYKSRQFTSENYGRVKHSHANSVTPGEHSSDMRKM